MLFTRILTVLALAALGLPAPATSARRAAAAALATSCDGCMGSGGSSAASGGSCGGFVSIEITVSPGRCKWFFSPDPWTVACSQKSGCTPTVQRTWSGLDAGAGLDFCVTVGSETMCVDPKPQVGGSGSGSDSRPSAELPCVDGFPRLYSVSAPGCDLTTSASASCSACIGSLSDG
jgi:hypothetical protein